MIMIYSRFTVTVLQWSLLTLHVNCKPLAKGNTNDISSASPPSAYPTDFSVMAARADELISERAEAGTGDPLTKRSPHRVTIPVMVISFQTHEEELGKRKLDIGPPVKELGELIKDVKKMDEENSPTKSQPGDTDSENESLDTSGRKAYDIITIPSPKNDEDTVVLMRARLTDANDRELTAKYGKKSKTKVII